jgi:ubiquitin-protein ligase
METQLHQRLLRDIAELRLNPYPNIKLHVKDSDLSYACLVLSPEGWNPMHLTVHFGKNYPLQPPRVSADSNIIHPNVFGGYICASILNTQDGYTPAYSLKGIAIQLLSFFQSESIEQDWGGTTKLADFRRGHQDHSNSRGYVCSFCLFDSTGTSPSSGPSKRRRRRKNPQAANGARTFALAQLPDELLLQVLEQLEFEELTNFSRSWERVSQLVSTHDLIRQLELQCFCTKIGFKQTELGVGVSLKGGRAKGVPESEFDLLSKDAFSLLGIRRSIHNIPFDYWLPLPISHRHWQTVRVDAENALANLRQAANLNNGTNAEVLYAFMSNIVVRLNEVASEPSQPAKSTLKHASEKAIEAYFHLFHLLLCFATWYPVVVSEANAMIHTFMSGRTSKADCPNLGHLLLALLISDVEPTEQLRKAIITEAITRNVVWLFDKRGGNMPELSYMEPDRISHYRLKKTFEGSRTSYRLLMFSELFRKTARPSYTKSLVEIRDELFDRHGGPPPGSAALLASEVRRLHGVNSFPQFFKEMGLVNVPDAERFTTVLRSTVQTSVDKGYSAWGLRQDVALSLRQLTEPTVGVVPGLLPKLLVGSSRLNAVTFFPQQNNNNNQRRR